MDRHELRQDGVRIICLVAHPEDARCIWCYRCRTWVGSHGDHQPGSSCDGTDTDSLVITAATEEFTLTVPTAVLGSQVLQAFCPHSGTVARHGHGSAAGDHCAHCGAVLA